MHESLPISVSLKVYVCFLHVDVVNGGHPLAGKLLW